MSELETVTDKWIYFIKEAQNLETSPQKMTEIPEIELALNLANEGNLTREELEELEAILWEA